MGNYKEYNLTERRQLYIKSPQFWERKLQESGVSQAFIFLYIITQVFISSTLLFNFDFIFPVLPYITFFAWFVALALILISIIKKLDDMQKLITIILYAITFLQWLFVGYFFIGFFAQEWHRFFVGSIALFGIAVMPFALSSESEMPLLTIIFIIMSVSMPFIVIWIENEYPSLFDFLRIMLFIIIMGIAIAFLLYGIRKRQKSRQKVRLVTKKVTGLVLFSVDAVIAGAIIISSQLLLVPIDLKEVLYWITIIGTIGVGIYAVIVIF